VASALGKSADGDETAMSLRLRAAVVLALGILCLAPMLLVTWMYYSHIWSDIAHWPGEALIGLAGMTVLYVSMVAGPSLITVSGGQVLLAGRASSAALKRMLAGATMSLAWSTFFVAVKPPDPPVRVVSWSMLLASVIVVILAATWLRQAATASLGESPSRPTRS
jgi:hypothetical protein